MVDSSVKTKETVQTVVGGKREDWIEIDRALRWREYDEDEEDTLVTSCEFVN